MSKLTREQRRILDSVEYNLERAAKFLARPDVAVALVRDRVTTTEDYTRPDGSVLTSITKDIGSDLVGIQFARRELRRLTQPVEPEEAPT
jgi:hypothetical protein